MFPLGFSAFPRAFLTPVFSGRVLVATYFVRLPQCYSHGCVIRCPEGSSAALTALVGSSERLLFPQALKLNSVQAAGQADLLTTKTGPQRQ